MWWRCTRLLLAYVIAPVALLVACELGLRAAGHGHSTRPFLKREHDGQLVHVRNREYLKSFLSWTIPESMWEDVELTVVEPKPDDCYRVFVFGGSTPEGWPTPSFSFSRYLAAMLRAQYPHARFEVYNTAFRAINSHVMRVQAKACAKFEPDLFVVYLGNNEVQGPFGPVAEDGEDSARPAAA